MRQPRGVWAGEEDLAAVGGGVGSIRSCSSFLMSLFRIPGRSSPGKRVGVETTQKAGLGLGRNQLPSSDEGDLKKEGAWKDPFS